LFGPLVAEDRALAPGLLALIQGEVRATGRRWTGGDGNDRRAWRSGLLAGHPTLGSGCAALPSLDTGSNIRSGAYQSGQDSAIRDI